jgi:hypothetical protein
MRPALFSKCVDEAQSALIAAVEVYNKPFFPYREEKFALSRLTPGNYVCKPSCSGLAATISKSFVFTNLAAQKLVRHRKSCT